MTRASHTWIPSALLAGHLGALVFGLIGLLIMLPNPELWAGDPRAVRVFDWSMDYAGATHILFGAATMFTFGVVVIGRRKTLTFFVVSVTLSLSFELIGTRAGWPFGNYEYTSFLGYKVLDRVPYTIPLSWFYMGLAAYLLGTMLASRLALENRPIWSVLLGALLLTVWDLVLDPAMAHESLDVKFWVWHEAGPYFGMPIKNFIGWSITGLLFMSVSRVLWKSDVEPDRGWMWFPTAVYVANLAFAMVISASVGLWFPVLLAVVLGLLPAVLAVRPRWNLTPWRMRWVEHG
jgi:uncharacterized membrane protein